MRHRVTLRLPMFSPEPLLLSHRLARHLGSRGLEPFLFIQEGWDWRWLSFAQVAEAVVTAARELSRLPAGVAVGFLDRLRTDDVILDLALQMAGLVSVPAPDAETARSRGARRWIDREGGAGSLERVEWKVPAPEWGAFGGGGTVTFEQLGACERAGGAVVVETDDGLATWSTADWASCGEEAARVLGPASLDPSGRDITVLAGRLSAPPVCAQLGWALASGAAVLLEGDAEAALETALWARPTVLAGSAADLARLAERPEAARTGRRAPLARLRACWVSDVSKLPAGLTESWERRGVRVLGMSCWECRAAVSRSRHTDVV